MQFLTFPGLDFLVFFALSVAGVVQAGLYSSFDKLPNSTYDFIIVGGEREPSHMPIAGQTLVIFCRGYSWECTGKSFDGKPRFFSPCP